jgi:hypothetical protein
MKTSQTTETSKMGYLQKALAAGTICAFMFMAIASTDVEETSAPPETSERLAMGTTASCGNVDVTITKIASKDRVGDMDFGTKASEGGILVVVEWSYKNTSKKPIDMFDGPSMSLVSEDGTTYESDVDATSSYATETENDEKVLSDLNPGITVKGAEVFEVSRELFDASKWSVKVESDATTCWFKMQ